MNETPVFSRAAAAAPHRLAAEAGRLILAEGGNAIEAMVAMAATIAVAYPHMNGVGGDGFWLIHEPGGRMRAIDACGPAGKAATMARYEALGVEAIPPRGPQAALTVAGTIGGWMLALALSRSLGGRLPLRMLLESAAALAREGVAVSASEARTRPFAFEALRTAPGFAEAFLAEGEIPPAGTLRRAPALAATLAQLADAGLDDFYRGDVGRELAADLQRIGAPLDRGDLERYRAIWVEPLALRLAGITVFNLPPPTQGLASLLILGLYARLGAARSEGFAHVHGLVEATKRAFRVRDAVVSDPARVAGDPSRFLTAEWLEKEAQAISMTRAAAFPLAWGEGDTVWMGAIDADGMAVSFIQSLYWEYGSGCVLPRTGVLWQNRGVAFALDPAARNALAPGRKPFHTLNPAMALREDGGVLAYGAMGGDGQPQFQAAIFTRHVMHGLDPLAAIEAPRWLLGKTWGSASTTLKVESRFDPTLVRALERAGHAVEVMTDTASDGFGHAGMLARDPRDGAVRAAHDPRADGGAAGL